MNVYEKLKVAYFNYSKNCGGDSALVVEFLFKEYLKEYPRDVQAHIQYALFLLFPPQHDRYTNLEYLYRALVLDRMNYLIIILLVYLKPMCNPGVENSLLEKLKNCNSSDLSIVSMSYFSLAQYYYRSDQKLYEPTMLKSIEVYPYHVNNYYYLAEYYLCHNRFKEAKILSELALKNLQKIIDIDSPETLDEIVDNFVNYYITGIWSLEHTREGLLDFIAYAEQRL